MLRENTKKRKVIVVNDSVLVPSHSNDEEIKKESIISLNNTFNFCNTLIFAVAAPCDESTAAAGASLNRHPNNSNEIDEIIIIEKRREEFRRQNAK